MVAHAEIQAGICGFEQVEVSGAWPIAGHWNAFAREIFRLAGLDVKVNPISTAEFGLPAARPLHSTLDCGKLAQETGFVPQPWQQALKRYLELRAEKRP